MRAGVNAHGKGDCGQDARVRPEGGRGVTDQQSHESVNRAKHTATFSTTISDSFLISSFYHVSERRQATGYST